MSGDGVWILQGKAIHASFVRENTLGRYGFYLHTYSEPAACVHLLREVRRVYP